MFRTVVMLITLAVASLFCTASEADLPTALHDCRSVEDSLERLRCYDELVDRTAARTPPPGQSHTGNWSIEDKVNPMDDTRLVVASLPAAEGVGRLGGPVTLYLRCQSGKTEAFVQWRDFLGLSAQVSTRFDQQDATSREWLLSTDRGSTFYPGNGLPFVAKVGAASRLAIEVTPQAGARNTAVFDLTGSQEVVQKIRTACGW